MVIGRDARRAERAPLVESVLGKPAASAGLDLLELLEYAWHDCYREITPPDDVILNILICSRGDLATMIHATKVALMDWRDLYLWAEHVNSEEQMLVVKRRTREGSRLAGGGGTALNISWSFVDSTVPAILEIAAHANMIIYNPQTDTLIRPRAH